MVTSLQVTGHSSYTKMFNHMRCVAPYTVDFWGTRLVYQGNSNSFRFRMGRFKSYAGRSAIISERD